MTRNLPAVHCPLLMVLLLKHHPDLFRLCLFQVVFLLVSIYILGFSLLLCILSLLLIFVPVRHRSSLLQSRRPAPLLSVFPLCHNPIPVLYLCFLLLQDFRCRHIHIIKLRYIEKARHFCLALVVFYLPHSSFIIPSFTNSS